MDTEMSQTKKTGWSPHVSTFSLRGSSKKVSDKYSGWKVALAKKNGKLVIPLRYIVIKGGKQHTPTRFTSVDEAHKYIMANYEEEAVKPPPKLYRRHR